MFILISARCRGSEPSDHLTNRHIFPTTAFVQGWGYHSGQGRGGFCTQALTFPDFDQRNAPRCAFPTPRDASTNSSASSWFLLSARGVKTRARAGNTAMVNCAVLSPCSLLATCLWYYARQSGGRITFTTATRQPVHAPRHAHPISTENECDGCCPSPP